MSSSFLEYMKFKNRESDKLINQKSVNQIRAERDKIYEKFSHITDVDMRKEYEKVHKDNRTYHNNLYLVP